MIVSAGQRDALYDAIVLRISGIDSLVLAIDAQEFDKATALSKEFSDYLRVLNDDLGWGKTSTEAVELVAPPDVWSRVLSQLREQSVQAAETAGERSELDVQEERVLRVRDVSAQLLGQLETTQVHSAVEHAIRA